MNLTIKRLRELLHYDPKTGIFTWLVRRRRMAAGSQAGTIRKNDKYFNIKVDGRDYSGHRLAWFYMTEEWPKDQIDHKDCNRHNNRWNNLRDSSQSQNMANSSLHRDNTSGFKGATKKDKKWQAQIKFRGRCHYLGCFSTPEAAHAAYMSASIKYFGEFARDK